MEAKKNEINQLKNKLKYRMAIHTGFAGIIQRQQTTAITKGDSIYLETVPFY